MCLCVDVYVNLLFSYNYNIYIDLTEKVRGRDGNKRGKDGEGTENWRKGYFFCLFYIIMWNGESEFFERTRSVITTLLRFISIPLCVRGPECEVVPQELHDECRVLIAVFIQCVKFCNCIIESLKTQSGVRFTCEKRLQRTKNLPQTCMNTIKWNHKHNSLHIYKSIHKMQTAADRSFSFTPVAINLTFWYTAHRWKERVPNP